MSDTTTTFMSSSVRRRMSQHRAFTLVEILIVVIILGILATIVIPQFTTASTDARRNALASQLQTIKSQLEMARLQHLDKDDAFLVAGGPVSGTTGSAAGPWQSLITKTNADLDASGHYTTTTPATGGQPPLGPYLQAPPTNPLNSWSGLAITANDLQYGDPSGASAGTGWIYNPTDGKVWATSAKGGFVYDEGNPSASTNEN